MTLENSTVHPSTFVFVSAKRGNKDIIQFLHILPETEDLYRNNIFKKLVLKKKGATLFSKYIDLPYLFSMFFLLYQTFKLQYGSLRDVQDYSSSQHWLFSGYPRQQPSTPLKKQKSAYHFSPTRSVKKL